MKAGLKLVYWLGGKSCTWVHDVWLHNAGTNKPKSAQQAKQGAYILHDCIYITFI